MIELNEGKHLELNGFTVVKFYGEWCAPCKKMDSVLVKMEKEFPEINYYSVDIDKFLKLTQEYRIMSVPTLIFFIGNKEVNRVQGLIMTEQLRKTFKTFTGKSKGE